jgi:hypothetical protein
MSAAVYCPFHTKGESSISDMNPDCFNWVPVGEGRQYLSCLD